MHLSEVYVKLGEDGFAELIRGISIGKLKTFQVYETLKVRSHLSKLNTESMRKATPRFWARLSEGDEEFARDLAQAVLVSHLGMITAVLDFLEIPNEGGFFAKDLEASKYLNEGWAERVHDKFRGVYPEPLLVFYINHLAWELTQAAEPFVPAA